MPNYSYLWSTFFSGSWLMCVCMEFPPKRFPPHPLRNGIAAGSERKFKEKAAFCHTFFFHFTATQKVLLVVTLIPSHNMIFLAYCRNFMSISKLIGYEWRCHKYYQVIIHSTFKQYEIFILIFNYSIICVDMHRTLWLVTLVTTETIILKVQIKTKTFLHWLSDKKINSITQQLDIY